MCGIRYGITTFDVEGSATAGIESAPMAATPAPPPNTAARPLPTSPAVAPAPPAPVCSISVASAVTPGLQLLPLDRAGRLRRHVQHHSVDVAHFIRDPRRDPLEYLVGQARPVRRHRIFGGDRSQHDRVPVGAAVALHDY